MKLKNINKVNEYEIIEIVNKQSLDDNAIKNWQEKYLYEKNLNLKKIFTNEELNILKKLDIFIIDGLYTDYDIDLIEEKIINIDKKILLKRKITKKEYEQLLSKFLQLR